MSRKKWMWLGGWCVVWIIFWAVFGFALPQNVHFPHSGVISPFLGPFIFLGGLFGAGGLTYPALIELFIPALIFWVVTVYLLKTKR